MGRFERKYVCNDGFFGAIDFERDAYWLGFLAADGYIRGNTVELCLSLRDREHIVAFASGLDCDAPVKNRSYAGYSDRSVLRFTSRRIVSAISEHGVVQRKSLILEWPAHLPTHLLRNWDSPATAMIETTELHRTSSVGGKVCGRRLAPCKEARSTLER